jgi:hypothetical protein
MEGANLSAANLVDVDLTGVPLTREQTLAARNVNKRSPPGGSVTIRVDERLRIDRYEDEVVDLYGHLRAAGVGDIEFGESHAMIVSVGSNAAARTLAHELGKWLVKGRRRLVVVKVGDHQIQVTGASHDAEMLLVETFRRALGPFPN